MTEVFVTEVTPENEEAFYSWMAKTHQIEATFPGFLGVYVQSPTTEQSRDWITFLHFDTAENLDQWLNSAERKKLLEESSGVFTASESHRLSSPFAGWFTARENASVWKQTMLVLLVLFPIVMLELKFLPYLTGSLNLALATFIGNAISVALIAWPFMPIAIKFLDNWLSHDTPRINIKGACIVTLLYILEVAIFWAF